MSNPTAAQVLVDVALLERLLSPEITTGENPEDWFDCRHCGSHWTNRAGDAEVHRSFCPVPAAQVALAQAQPSSASGLEMALRVQISRTAAWMVGDDLLRETHFLLRKAQHAISRDADQQARLRALVGTWRGHIAWLEDEGDTGKRHQAFTECADELEAVLGGKEND